MNHSFVILAIHEWYHYFTGLVSMLMVDISVRCM